MNGTSYVPKEIDLTLQNSDTWFYQPGRGYRSLEEMVSIYHDSVGYVFITLRIITNTLHNQTHSFGGNMLLNLAPMPDSSIPTNATKLYRALGDFIRNCYDTSNAVVSNGRCEDCLEVNLTSSLSFTFDRVVLKEELLNGQIVTQYQVVLDNGTVIFNGTAVGRTAIVRLDQNYTASSVRIEILETRGDLKPTFREVYVPDPLSCVVNGGSHGTGCKLESDIIIAGFPVPDLKPTQETGPDACCTKCRNESECVAFTFVPSSSSLYTCTLLRATGGEDKHVTGAISGFPNY